MKTTAAKQPQAVRITSERQLDDTGVGSLFLHVVAVDEREVAPGAAVPGESLPGEVAAVRLALDQDASVLSAFEDQLIERGYLDIHAPRHEGRRYNAQSILEPHHIRQIKSLLTFLTSVSLAALGGACENRPCGANVGFVDGRLEWRRRTEPPENGEITLPPKTAQRRPLSFLRQIFYASVCKKCKPVPY